MKIIYHPKGKAGEYADFAVNLFTGCDHLCTYCYSPAVLHTTREDFKNVHPRVGILHKLEEDAQYLQLHPELGKSVFLCFTCDPYPRDDPYELTRHAILILHNHGINVTILTKGGIRPTRDFDLLTDKDQFGVTLTCLNAMESLKWEPGAGLPEDRIDSLREAYYKRIKTWVSLEPVLNPQATLDIIERTHEYVDMFKVGKLNYHPLAETIDWAKFTKDAVALLDSLGKKYYIKTDLQKYLNQP